MASRYREWAMRFRVSLGFALGMAFLVFSQPTGPFLAAGACIALVGLVLRGWAAGYLDKNRKLATAGPYGYTRNPLYLGSLLMGAGFAWAGCSWLLGVGFLLLFVLVYWPVIRAEEAFMRGQFGETYHRYASGVPLFFPPRLRAARASEHAGFQWRRYKKNREYEAALGYLAGVAFLVLKMKLR